MHYHIVLTPTITSCLKSGHSDKRLHRKFSPKNGLRPFRQNRVPTEEEKGKFDELVEEKGVSILVEPKAVMHVIGMKMDFVDDKLRSEFVFINPNSIGECSCGESFISKST